MRQADVRNTSSGIPAGDALPPYQRPAFDANRRWYDDYLDMLHRANSLAIHNGWLYQYIARLQQATKNALTETDGGSFLSAQTKEQLKTLLDEPISATYYLSQQ